MRRSVAEPEKTVLQNRPIHWRTLYNECSKQALINLNKLNI